MLQSDRQVLGEDGKSYPKYSDEWKKAANKVISGGDYDASLEYFKNNIPNELNSALQQMNIPIKDLNMNVLGTDVYMDGNNSFTIYYDDPYTEKRESVKFMFDTPGKSTNNVMKAMDKIILNIVNSYNTTEGGELLKDAEEKKKKGAPTS